MEKKKTDIEHRVFKTLRLLNEVNAGLGYNKTSKAITRAIILIKGLWDENQSLQQGKFQVQESEQSHGGATYLIRECENQCSLKEDCPVWLEFARQLVGQADSQLVLTREVFQRVKNKWLADVIPPSPVQKCTVQELPNREREKLLNELLDGFARLEVVSECRHHSYCLDRLRYALNGKKIPYPPV
ncbi:MAG: hypothetical protein L3J71_03630 [Victivallaceae bacterium]|nr:hypothetical protein [Victivallaceae bacterium]